MKTLREGFFSTALPSFFPFHTLSLFLYLLIVFVWCTFPFSNLVIGAPFITKVKNKPWWGIFGHFVFFFFFSSVSFSLAHSSAGFDMSRAVCLVFHFARHYTSFFWVGKRIRQTCFVRALPWVWWSNVAGMRCTVSRITRQATQHVDVDDGDDDDADFFKLNLPLLLSVFLPFYYYLYATYFGWRILLLTDGFQLFCIIYTTHDSCNGQPDVWKDLDIVWFGHMVVTLIVNFFCYSSLSELTFTFSFTFLLV